MERVIINSMERVIIKKKREPTMLPFASVSEFTTYTNYKTSTTLLSIQKHSGLNKCQP